MGITERRQRQKEEVRASILSAAWQLVSTEGWQAMSIRKIADAIEYSVPVIYDHFENKEAILLEFTKQGFRLLNDTIKKATAPYTEPEAQIEAIAYAYWNFAFDNNEYYQLMYGMGLPGCDTVAQISELKDFTGLVMDPINRMMEKSGNKDAEAFLKLHTFWSMLHGMVSINMMNKGNSRDELNMMVLKDFIKGFISGIKV
ncbi:MAG: TetR/AcrR family transcriptional regulator [Taibaiella sp.]|nr:TetR/AcrR family transcriptional regulator [Taibaiella sp.]